MNLFRARLRLISSVVSLKPFDISTADGRSKERYRRVALTTLTSVAAKGISSLTILVSVPLTLEYLDTERYGLWMTISSTVAMLGFADLGMGNGLMNALSEANGKGDRAAAQEYVSSAFFMLSGVAFLIAILFFTSYPFIPWHHLFNVTSDTAIKESGPAVAAFIACFALSIPLGVVHRIQMGYQEGFINDLWVGLGNALGLGGALLAIYFRVGLPWLVLAIAGAPLLSSVLSGVVLFGVKRTWLRPSWHHTTSESAQKIFSNGFLFLILQATVSFAYMSDNIIAARLLGPEAVATYSVPSRLFSIVSTMLSMILYPLWPAYGESISRGDLKWVRQTFLRSIVISSVVSGLISIILVLFGAKIIYFWVGTKVIPTFPLLLGFGLLTVINCSGGAIAVFLNGANIIRFQVICGLFMAVGALITKIIMAHLIGLPGIIWGTIIAYGLFNAVPFAFYIPKLLSNYTK